MDYSRCFLNVWRPLQSVTAVGEELHNITGRYRKDRCPATYLYTEMCIINEKKYKKDEMLLRIAVLKHNKIPGVLSFSD